MAVITYRTFRNWDPPALVDLWNTSVSGRGSARGIWVQDLDRLILSKPYFDPAGIILAENGARAVGFVHAGFGAGDGNSALSRRFGVITMLLVAPKYRRQGIGRELVRRAETYLRTSGSQVIYAGSVQPLNPFYLGLYGGSELPGILQSDEAVHHLFQSLGYRPADECLVLQRNLQHPVGLTNARARAWARRLEFRVEPQPVPSDWWSACQFSCIEDTLFELLLRSSGQTVARAVGWEIQPLAQAWGVDAVGITRVEVHADYRNQGLGTCLMIQVLRHYRHRLLALAEVQTMAHNQAAQRLYQRLGFTEVDRGIVYRAASK